MAKMTIAANTGSGMRATHGCRKHTRRPVPAQPPRPPGASAAPGIRSCTWPNSLRLPAPPEAGRRPRSQSPAPATHDSRSESHHGAGRNCVQRHSSRRTRSASAPRRVPRRGSTVRYPAPAFADEHGSVRSGRPARFPPREAPSKGRQVTVSTSTSRVPGSSRPRRSKTSIARQQPPSSKLAVCHCSRLANNSISSGPGKCLQACSPHNLASCLAVITTAMPRENPRTTGRAMYCASRPNCSALQARKSTPAIRPCSRPVQGLHAAHVGHRVQCGRQHRRRGGGRRYDREAAAAEKRVDGQPREGAQQTAERWHAGDPRVGNGLGQDQPRDRQADDRSGQYTFTPSGLPNPEGSGPRRTWRA